MVSSKGGCPMMLRRFPFTLFFSLLFLSLAVFGQSQTAAKPKPHVGLYANP